MRCILVDSCWSTECIDSCSRRRFLISKSRERNPLTPLISLIAFQDAKTTNALTVPLKGISLSVTCVRLPDNYYRWHINIIEVSIRRFRYMILSNWHWYLKMKLEYKVSTRCWRPFPWFNYIFYFKLLSLKN